MTGQTTGSSGMSVSSKDSRGGGATRFTSRDGLMSSTDAGAVALWEDIVARSEFAEMSWTEILRARGVKYAHPDDGWVKRDRCTHTRSWYPQFDDHPEVGDLIAFGSPPSAFYADREGRWYHSNHEREGEFKAAKEAPECAASGYRICRVVDVERRHSILGYHQSFTFEDTGERMPPRAPTLREKALAGFKRKRRASPAGGEG